MSQKAPSRRNLLTVAIAGLMSVTTVGIAAPAQASTPTQSIAVALVGAPPTFSRLAVAGDVGVSADFAAQTRQAGLTTDQAAQLQANVDSELKTSGGIQISANRIELPGKGNILIVVPGETYARDLAAGEPIRTQAACPFQYFCMYRGQNYGGGQWNLWACGTYRLTDWVGVGSYINNQTRGTWTSLRDVNFNVVTWSQALELNRHYNWNPIWYVVPC